MGRPRATRTNCEFAVSLANCVTTVSDYKFEWIARRGQHGIFELLHHLAPKVGIFLFLVYPYRAEIARVSDNSQHVSVKI